MKRLPKRLLVGLALVAAGQFLSVVHVMPFSDYYFPVVWYGYVLTIDGALGSAGKPSLLTDHRPAMAIMVPVSAAFWWLFELFDKVVHSWTYVGAGGFTEFGYFALATVCFSTVLPAIWETAMAVASLSGGRRADSPIGSVTEGIRARWPNSATASSARGGEKSARDVPRSTQGLWHRETLNVACQRAVPSGARNALFVLELGLGVACVALPVLFPHYAFALIWGSLFFLLDPLNGWLWDRSILIDVLEGSFRTALTFAVAALICGFFWEFWNYWAAVKWVYSVPYVSQLHLFEMPLPGYLGYLPFGLEAYAATIFVVTPLMGLLAVLDARSSASASRVRRPARPVTRSQRKPASPE